MNENLITQEKLVETAEISMPNKFENIENNASSKTTETIDSKSEGQSEKSDPKGELILGKFKTVEDLTKAYEELQKLQGKASQEVGNLRKNLADFSNLREISGMLSSYQESIIPVIKRDRELYNTPEYFQNDTFNEMYTEALMAYGDNLDTDRMVGLLEAYVKDRIAIYEKSKSAQDETRGVLDSMSYSKNPNNSISNPKKSLSEMTEAEFRESIRKLI
jgi:hypothetical protein